MTSKVPTSDLKRTVKANRTSKSAGFMVVLWWFDEDSMGIIWDLMEFIRTYIMGLIMGFHGEEPLTSLVWHNVNS